MIIPHPQADQQKDFQKGISFHGFLTGTTNKNKTSTMTFGPVMNEHSVLEAGVYLLGAASHAGGWQSLTGVLGVATHVELAGLKRALP